MRKREKFKPIFKQWLYSYICIAIIPVVLCCGMYFSYEKILMTQLENQNKYIMSTVQRNSMKTLTNIKNMALTMRNDIRMDHVVNISSTEDYWGNNDVYEISRELQNYAKYTIGSYSKLYIYLRNTDMILSEYGILDTFEFYNLMFNKEKISYKKWMGTLNEPKKVRFVPVTYYDRETELEYDGLEYLVPTSNGGALIAIVIDENVIFEDIYSSQWGEACNAYLFNADGGMLLSCVRNQDNVNNIDEMTKSNGVVRLTEGVSVDNTRWKIITEVDKYQILESRYLFRKTFLLFIILNLIIIYFVIRKLLKKNYAPVHSLAEILNVENGNEFESMKKSIQDLLFKNGMLVEKSEIQAVKLHKLLLEKTIAGTAGDGFLLNGQMDMVDILFEYPCVCIAVLNVEKGEIFNINNNRIPEKDKLFNISMGNIVSETCKHLGLTGEFLEIGSHYLCVFNFNTEKSKMIASVLDEIVKKAYDIFRIKIFYSKSKVSEAIDQLPVCYRQACEVDEYKKLFLFCGNINYERYEESLKNEEIFTGDDERVLVNLLKYNNKALVKGLIDKLFADITFLNGASLEMLYGFISRITDIVKDSFDENSEQFAPKINEKIHTLLTNHNSVKETYINLLEVVNIMCDDQPNEIGNNKNMIIEEITKFIEENYNDRNLSVSMISSKFQLGSSYIIKIFKESTSMTLLEYIADYRTKKAIELMENTTYSNQTICDMVGFNHIKTFNRTFKKITGVTPASYKKAGIKKEEN